MLPELSEIARILTGTDQPPPDSIAGRPGCTGKDAVRDRLGAQFHGYPQRADVSVGFGPQTASGQSLMMRARTFSLGGGNRAESDPRPASPAGKPGTWLPRPISGRGGQLGEGSAR